MSFQDFGSRPTTKSSVAAASSSSSSRTPKDSLSNISETLLQYQVSKEKTVTLFFLRFILSTSSFSHTFSPKNVPAKCRNSGKDCAVVDFKHDSASTQRTRSAVPSTNGCFRSIAGQNYETSATAKSNNCSNQIAT